MLLARPLQGTCHHCSRALRRGVRITVRAGATATTIERPQLLSAETAPSLLKDLDCVLFDCDGVLWTGSRQIPGAAQALQVLRDQGKRVLFVTNNASKSRAQYVSKFTSLGLSVKAEEIISASYAAAAYLSSQGFGPGVSAAQQGKKVLVLGQAGVEQELTQAGIPWLGGSDWQPPLLADTDALANIQLDSDIGAVLVSWDPAFSFSRLVIEAYAASCIRELPGCVFVATNPDDADTLGPPLRHAQPGIPLPDTRTQNIGPDTHRTATGQDAVTRTTAVSDTRTKAGQDAGTSTSTHGRPTTAQGGVQGQPLQGQSMQGQATAGQGVGVHGQGHVQPRMMPGTGCLVAAVAAASARQPVVVGKGGPWLLPFLLQEFDLDPARTAIVGDRLDTDIALGRAGGLVTVLTLTGVGTQEQALAASPESAPHYMIPSVAALAGMSV